jgi:hypothetical protein
VEAKVRRLPSSRSSNLKGRIAEAFVEAVFRRAGYFVSRTGRESQVQRLLKAGSDGYLPDFLIRKAVKRQGSDRPLHRLIPIEVKYRRDLGRFLDRFGHEAFKHAARNCPDVCFVFVTDNPGPGRSCFQVVDLLSNGELVTRDLHTVKDFEIYETTVLEYEQLIKEIFPLLDGRAPNSKVAGTQA